MVEGWGSYIMAVVRWTFPAENFAVIKDISWGQAAILLVCSFVKIEQIPRVTDAEVKSSAGKQRA